MTHEQDLKLHEIVGRMRKKARARGPHHEYWDYIFELELILAHKPTEHKRSVAEYIEIATQLEKA